MKTAEEVFYETKSAHISFHNKPITPEANMEIIYQAMEEYANQYLNLLIKIIKAREGAQTTQDLFAVLKEIELAITILKLKA